jgi:hypothetical protein
MKNILAFFCISMLFACNNNIPEDPALISCDSTASAPVIDGKADELCWKSSKTRSIDQLWVGKLPHAMDYMGKFKLAWDKNHLYVLAEIYDDTLMDTHSNGLEHFWDDDCLEVFIDENASGGIHQYNHSAFAYHIALDGRIVDTGKDSVAHYFNDHAKVALSQNGKVTTWELAFDLYPDTFKESGSNIPVSLYSGKNIGFAIAYNDNDGSKERENMMGNLDVKPNPDKNRGWIDAGIFARMLLK